MLVRDLRSIFSKFCFNRFLSFLRSERIDVSVLVVGRIGLPDDQLDRSAFFGCGWIQLVFDDFSRIESRSRRS